MKKNAARKKAKTENTLPKDLEDLLGSTRALSTIHALLQRGMFPVQEHVAIVTSIKFVETLHKESLALAMAHPEAGKSPELNALKRTPEEQAALDKEFLEVVEKSVDAQAVQ